MLLRMAERRGSCWSTAGQRYVIFKDDLEGLGGSSLPKTHLDDVLIVRLALHQGRNIKDKARHLDGDDLDGNGHSPACQDGSVDDLGVLQGGRGRRSSAECVSPETCLSPTAATPQRSTSSGEVQGSASAQSHALLRCLSAQTDGCRSRPCFPGTSIPSPEPKLSG